MKLHPPLTKLEDIRDHYCLSVLMSAQDVSKSY